MATPKRKYSFGLISRLSLIAAFVGLGSWAVFNSKFKEEDPQQVAENGEDEAGQQTSENSESGKSASEGEGSKPENNEESTVNRDSKAQPASFIDNSNPANPKKSKRGNQGKKNSSSVSFGATGTSSPTKGGVAEGSATKSMPPKSSFSLNDTTKKSGGFSPPSSSFSLNSEPKQKNKTGKSSGKKKAAKSGPPSSTFNPSASFSGQSAKQKKTASGPPSSSFSLDSKTAPAKPSSTFNPSGTSGGFSVPGKSGGKSVSKANEKQNSSGPPSATFNPSAGGLATKGKSSGPPSSTFDPRGSFTTPGASKGESRNDNSKSFSDTKPNQFSGGFQSKSSDGSEKPLRGGGSGFSLSSDNQKVSPSTPGRSGSSGNPSSNAKTNSVQPNRFGGSSFAAEGGTSRPTTSPKFGGSSAFQDKGSKPLPKSNQPKSNGLVQSKGSTGLGSSSTGFADIGQPKKNGISDSATSLDPSKINSGGSTNPGSRNVMGAGRSNAVGGRNAAGQGSGLADTKSLNPRSGFASQGAGAGGPAKFSSNPNVGGTPQAGSNDRRPGPSSLEGIQAPAVTLQKVSPREIQVNVEASFNLILRNVGRATATNVTVVDPIPDGTQFVSADPAPTERGTDGSLIWKFGAIAPSQQKVITVKLLPKKQGEIGSVARMSFQSAATAKSVCTKPEISVTHNGPRKILMGQNARFVVTVQNNGDGVAKNVIIEDEVPAGFAFGSGKGNRLAYEIGNLAPGTKREVQLNLRATEPGRYVNEVRVKMAKTTAASHKLDVEVIAPKLKMEIVGPTRRYIQREATYKVEVENNGTASAKNVLMVTRLPKGLKYVRTNNRGQYNPREHAVYWSMVELSPQNKGGVELVLMPIGTGQQEIEFEARSVLDRTDLKKFPVIVDQLAELFFEVDDRDDPIEVNGETEYRIRVVNQGSKAATNVNINVEMPVEIQAIDTHGPSKGAISGQRVVFAPIPTLAPRGELIYKIKAKGTRDGEHLIKVLLSSNERREAVAKQESTKVYSEYR